jgi:hypothetical protein
MPDSSPSEEELIDQQFRANLQVRLDRLDRGEGLVFENEEALQRFFDQIKAEGRARLQL